MVDEMCGKVTTEISSPGDRIDFARFEEIFGSLNVFQIIPHYDKKPAIRGEVLERLDPYIVAEEVDSEKKSPANDSRREQEGRQQQDAIRSRLRTVTNCAPGRRAE